MKQIEITFINNTVRNITGPEEDIDSILEDFENNSFSGFFNINDFYYNLDNVLFMTVREKEQK